MYFVSRSTVEIGIIIILKIFLPFMQATSTSDLVECRDVAVQVDFNDSDHVTGDVKSEGATVASSDNEHEAEGTCIYSDEDSDVSCYIR